MCTTGEVWVVEDQGRGKGWSVYVFMYLWLPNESYRREVAPPTWPGLQPRLPL